MQYETLPFCGSYIVARVRGDRTNVFRSGIVFPTKDGADAWALHLNSLAALKPHVVFSEEHRALTSKLILNLPLDSGRFLTYDDLSLMFGTSRTNLRLAIRVGGFVQPKVAGRKGLGGAAKWLIDDVKRWAATPLPTSRTLPPRRPKAHPSGEKTFMSKAEVCRLLGVSDATLNKLLASGDFPPYRFRVSKACRWAASEVFDWIAQGGSVQ